MRFLIVVCFLVILGACKKEEGIIEKLKCQSDTIMLDRLFLDSLSLQSIPYRGSETIFFKNQYQDEVRIEPSLTSVFPYSFFTGRVFNLDCFGGGINNYYSSTEQLHVSFECKSLKIRYFVNIFIIHSTANLAFADVLFISMRDEYEDGLETKSIGLKFITSYRGYNEQIKDELFLRPNATFLTEITLLNKTFINVYKVSQPEEEGLTELYYNKEFGIVAFKDLDFNLWVFDRFE